MTQKTRNELKDLFKTGAKPSGDDFKAFIDSTLNVTDDGIAKAAGADTPLKINAQGTDEKLLDFYAGETKTWSINQKPADDKSGLNIATPGGSKLFLASDTGNVGIGTTSPDAKLEINGYLKLQSGVAVNEFTNDGTLSGNSDLAIPTEKAVKTYADTKALLAGSSSQNFAANNLTLSNNLKLKLGATVNEFSTDGTLSGNSDLAIPTEKAVKTYADTKALLAGSSSQDFAANNLTINGNLQTNRALIDDRFSGYATFSHKDCDGGSYALAQHTYGNTFLNAASDHHIYFRIDDGNKMILTSDGYLGIGTTSPSKGKLQVEGSKSYIQPGGYCYFNRGVGLYNINSANAPYSIYASNYIGAAEFNAFSDLRIKEVKGISDSKSDLNVLRQINITNYTYKDKIANDDKPRKKVIGQQVAEVFPQAVKTHTDVVPDIFKSASITNGWVNLCDHELQVGERVKLILENSEPQMYTIEAVTPESFQVSLDHEGEVFVYGREVNDFHVVDYEALSMLNVSATQELCKIIDALKIEVKQLKTQLRGVDYPMAAFTNS